MDMPDDTLMLPARAAAATAAPDAAPDCLDDWSQLIGAMAWRLRQPDFAAHREACARALEQTQDNLLACLQQATQVQRALRLELTQARRQIDELQQQLATLRTDEARAQHRARHDELTDLPNRAPFRERLDRALTPGDRRRPSLAVLFLDLDGFKRINDEHGHQAGDALLRAVAARLAGAVRAGDMVCRLGGDEFVCLPGHPMDREELAELARKLMAAVAEPLKLNGSQGPALMVRPSIGIAHCAPDGATAEGLLAQADAAMYTAKRQGSGYAFFNPRGEPSGA